MLPERECVYVCVCVFCVYMRISNANKRAQKIGEKERREEKIKQIRTRDENYDSVQPWIIPILNDFTQIYNILSINLLFVNSIFFFVDFFFLLSFSSFVRLPNTKT